MRRSRRSGVEDLWTKTVRDADGNTQSVPSARDGRGMRWRARYVDERGGEHSKAFGRKVDAQLWLDKQTAALVSAFAAVAPRDAQLMVQRWCDLWIEGYKVNRESTVRQARTHCVPRHRVSAAAAGQRVSRLTRRSRARTRMGSPGG
jgi:hypothetical protein